MNITDTHRFLTRRKTANWRDVGHGTPHKVFTWIFTKLVDFSCIKLQLATVIRNYITVPTV